MSVISSLTESCLGKINVQYFEIGFASINGSWLELQKSSTFSMISLFLFIIVMGLNVSFTKCNSQMLGFA
jgi:hypothetical protein